jgi:NAD(P)-dependent dehydrogenase (short-subunit alcohol dehydrogenase family)
MRRVLITGANRGLGLAFTRRYLARGDHVLAGCRRPEAAAQLHELKAAHPAGLTTVEMDVGNIDSIRKSHAVVRRQVDGLELLINNAGIFSIQGSGEPKERLGKLDFEDALQVLQVNAVGPLIVAQQYLDLLRAGTKAKIVSISSGYGSISANTEGFPYYYSASKAAMNMYMRSLAADTKRWGIITVLLDPGWVSTEMGGPEAPITPEQAVDGMIQVIDGLTPRHNGCFLDWKGAEQIW